MKKSILGIIVMVVALFFTISCGSSTSTPSAVAKASIECIMANDYEGYVDLIYIQEKKGQTVEEQKQMLVGLIQGKAAKSIENKNGIKSYEVVSEDIAEDGKTAKVKMNVTYADGTTDDQTIKLIKVDSGDWMLDPAK